MVEQKPNIIPERHLLDALERVNRNPVGFMVIYMFFSKLRPQNKQLKQLRVLARMFDPIINSTQSRLFALTNGDMVVLGRGISYALADEVINKFREMLQADPLIYDNPEDALSNIYDLEKDYHQVYSDVEEIYKTAIAKKNEPPPRPKDKNIEPDHLDEILKNIAKLDVTDIIRRQSAVYIGEDACAKVVFQEYFTSVFDLKKAVSPSINLLGDRWLFQHLTETLDRRMLGVLAKTKLFVKPPALNLNLNISTVFSREFASFAKQVLTSGQKITVEVQLMDIFQNIGNYYDARDMLHKGGHKILIDGMAAINLQFLDVSLLDADYIKLIWSPGLTDENQEPNPRDLIDTIGAENVVLARCDAEDGIKWGLSVGVRTFQGYFIDAMAGAMGKKNCKHGNSCTLGQCINRRGVIAGKMRQECHEPFNLDDIPTIRSI